MRVPRKSVGVKVHKNLKILESNVQDAIGKTKELTVSPGGHLDLLGRPVAGRKPTSVTVRRPAHHDYAWHLHETFAVPFKNAKKLAEDPLAIDFEIEKFFEEYYDKHGGFQTLSRYKREQQGQVDKLVGHFKEKIYPIGTGKVVLPNSLKKVSKAYEVDHVLMAHVFDQRLMSRLHQLFEKQDQEKVSSLVNYSTRHHPDMWGLTPGSLHLKVTFSKILGKPKVTYYDKEGKSDAKRVAKYLGMIWNNNKRPVSVKIGKRE
ncbi:MAG: hypothetical protein ACE5DI_00530 [Candidatus Micrarchaeia archaeon]